MTELAVDAAAAFAPVYVELVRINNFRGITACELGSRRT